MTFLQNNVKQKKKFFPVQKKNLQTDNKKLPTCVTPACL